MYIKVCRNANHMQIMQMQITVNAHHEYLTVGSLLLLITLNLGDWPSHPRQRSDGEHPREMSFFPVTAQRDLKKRSRWVHDSAPTHDPWRGGEAILRFGPSDGVWTHSPVWPIYPGLKRRKEVSASPLSLSFPVIFLEPLIVKLHSEPPWQWFPRVGTGPPGPGLQSSNHSALRSPFPSARLLLGPPPACLAVNIEGQMQSYISESSGRSD